jgi:hypothetical protein
MLHWRMAHMGPAVTAEIARAKLAGLMVDRKELKIHKIDSMSRDQLELRLQQLVQENQIVLGQATEIVEDEDEELKRFLRRLWKIQRTKIPILKKTIYLKGSFF